MEWWKGLSDELLVVTWYMGFGVWEGGKMADGEGKDGNHCLDDT